MSSNSDFLAGRLKVDAIPYRQSGSHVSPLSSLESSSRQLSGSLIIELEKAIIQCTFNGENGGT